MRDKNVMITFGTGGHSTEMLMLIEDAQLERKIELQSIDRLVLVVSQDDHLIEKKINSYINKKSSKNSMAHHEDKSMSTNDTFRDRITTIKLRRARSVGQSYLTSIWTTIISLLHSISVIIQYEPKFLLTNGPGISVVLCFALRILQTLSLGLRYSCKILYVESFCRTRNLSLSGKIIYHLRLANQFYVQWPKLAELYPRAKYKGLLV